MTAEPEALWAWCSEARQQRDRMERTMLELAEGVAELEPLT